MELGGEVAYLFRHALLREVAYELQVPSARAKLHALAIELLIEVVGNNSLAPLSPELALHARAAGEGLSAGSQLDQIRSEERRFTAMAGQYLQAEYQDHYALEFLNRGMEICGGTELADVALLRAETLARVSQFKLFEAAAARAYEIGQDLGDKKTMATALRLRHEAARRFGRMEEARAFLQQARDLYEQLKDKTGIATTEAQFGILHRFQGNLDEAMGFYARAEELAQADGNRKLVARLRSYQGEIHALRRDFKTALDYAAEALSVAREIGARDGVAVMLNQQGNYLTQVGRIEEAIECFDQSAALASEIGDVLGHARALGNCGGAFNEARQLAKARERYELALGVAEEFGELRLRMIHLHNLGRNDQRCGRLRESVNWLERAIEIAQKISDAHQEASTRTLLAESLTRLGRIDEARAVCEKVIRDNAERAPIRPVWMARTQLAYIEWMSGNHQNAESLSQESVKIAEATGVETNFVEACVRRALLQYRRREIPEALESLKGPLDFIQRDGDRHWSSSVLALALRAVCDEELGNEPGAQFRREATKVLAELRSGECGNQPELADAYEILNSKE